MNIQDINQIKEEIIKDLEQAEDKSQAIYDAFEKYSEYKYSALIADLQSQAVQAEADKEYTEKLGLRTLSQKEKDFYNKYVLNPKQAITGDQADIIPTSIQDLTLADIRETDDLLSHINFAPSDVKRWYTASKSGAFFWSKLKDALDRNKDIEATFNTIITELGKLYLLIIIPKSIRDLSLPFVDKYFRTVLKEQETEGLIYGFLLGNGVEQPIGIYKQINSVDSQTKVHQDKTLNTDLTTFKPKALANAKKTLSKNGKRKADALILICNPADRYDYVDPCIYDSEGKLISAHKNLKVYEEPQNPQGKAALYLDKTYTMGCSGMKVKEYDQTLALEDADVMIATGYANGRAIDDNCAYVFDVTKLEEYVPVVRVLKEEDSNIA